MNKIIKNLLALILIIGAGISFLLILEKNKNIFGENYAPCNINVEIDKHFAQNVSIHTDPPQNGLFFLAPTTPYEDDLPTIIMHVNLDIKGFQRDISLRIQEDMAEQTIAAIDNISVFVGNKLFYFSSDDIQKLNRATKNGYALYHLPGIKYASSLLTSNVINSYGDLNLAVIGITAFIVYPAKFIVTWLFIICFFVLFKKQITNIYYQTYKHKNIREILALFVIITFAFLLRFNGYDRHSGWLDEIYAATISSPKFPFMQTFTDPGNPPFYYILLRICFTLFGWTETTGRMLSVVLGTGAVLSLYFFVKQNFDKKCAFCAALFMTVSTYAIGWSQEMRGNILRIFLVSIVALAFFAFMKKTSIKNLLLYIIPSMCLANTHYFGVLFIISNFLFYIIYLCIDNSFDVKKIVVFFIGNIVIAISFMPFFLFTALKQTLLNTKFAVNADKLGTMHFLVTIGILLLFVIIISYRKRIYKVKNFNTQEKHSILYLVFVSSFMFVVPVIISLIRPVFRIHYFFTICFPFFVALAAILATVVSKQIKVKYISIFVVYAFIVAFYVAEPGGTYSAYKECRAFIATDATAHAQKKVATLDGTKYGNYSFYPEYYGFPVLPTYSVDESTDILYFPHYAATMHEEQIFAELANNDIENSNILKIRVNDNTVVYKKIMLVTANTSDVLNFD